MLLKKNQKKSCSFPFIKIDNTNIDKVFELNFLGISFSEQLNWKSHIDKISNRCSRMICILNRLKRLLPFNIKIILYNTLILPHLNYGVMAWGYKCDRIQKLQKKLVRIISVSKYKAHTEPLFTSFKLPTQNITHIKITRTKI